MNDKESIMKANKDYSKAFIDCWFMHTYCSHKSTIFKPESLHLVHFTVFGKSSWLMHVYF